MRFVLKCVAYAVFLLIIGTFVIIMHQINAVMYPALESIATGTEHYGTMSSIWTNFEMVGWVVLLIFIVGGAIYLLASAHADEYETYEYFNRR